MGKLLGLLVAVVGGVVAFHSLATLDRSSTDRIAKPAQAVVTSNISEAVPTPLPATAERRRNELQARKSAEKTTAPQAPPALVPIAQQILTSATQPVEQKPAPRPALVKTAEAAPKLAIEAPAERRAPVHADLARAIQGHLSRVGCYAGPVSGVWSEATQRAMKDFNTHVNASLPVERPDQVLLALVENYNDKACSCLTSETIVNGRCVPSRSQQAQRKAPPEFKGVRKSVTAKIAEETEVGPKPATVESWKTTARIPEQRSAKSPDPSRNAKPVAVPPPTVVATARQQLEQAKEQERRNVDTSTRMGLGLKPAPATTPQPSLTVATLPQPQPQPQITETTAERQRVAAIIPPPAPRTEETSQARPNTRTAPVAEKVQPSKYVRRVSPPPPPVIYRTTSTSYSSYLRNGGIWRRHELNGK